MLRTNCKFAMHASPLLDRVDNRTSDHMNDESHGVIKMSESALQYPGDGDGELEKGEVIFSLWKSFICDDKM